MLVDDTIQTTRGWTRWRTAPKLEIQTVAWSSPMDSECPAAMAQWVSGCCLKDRIAARKRKDLVSLLQIRLTTS